MLPTSNMWIQQIVFCQTYNDIQISAIKTKRKIFLELEPIILVYSINDIHILVKKKG